MGNSNTRTIEAVHGKVISSIQGMTRGSKEITITFDDGTKLTLNHDQSCCEHVRIEDVAGDVADLVGKPLRLCEEVTVGRCEWWYKEYRGTMTSTWYKFVSMEGAVTVRWMGESTGDYSESVDIELRDLNDVQVDIMSGAVL